MFPVSIYIWFCDRIRVHTKIKVSVNDHFEIKCVSFSIYLLQCSYRYFWYAVRSRLSDDFGVTMNCLMISILIYCKIISYRQLYSVDVFVISWCQSNYSDYKSVFKIIFLVICTIKNRHRRSWIKFFLESVIEFVSFQIYHWDVLCLRIFFIIRYLML